MAHPGFAHLWQQQELSDVDIVVIAGAPCAEDSAPAGDSMLTEGQPLVLQQFPGHSSILSISQYCKAQALRWPVQEPDSGLGVSVTDSMLSSGQQARRKIHITLPDASYESAAMAVLSAMYLVKPVQELLGDLAQQQLLQTAVLADMMGAPLVVDAAVECLTAALNSAEGLEAVAADHLLAMTAVPDCLLQLLHQTLFDRLGDLEAVWADAGLRQSLLNLPVQTMELLLSSDSLKVASEDTVLYTAQAYVDKLKGASLDRADIQLVGSKLAALVRVPQLSTLWQAASALADCAQEQLLGGQQKQLRQLLLLQASVSQTTAKDIKAVIPSAPASWLLGPRTTKKAGSVRVEWGVDVSAVKQTAQAVAASRTTQWLSTRQSPISAPLMGISWQLKLLLKWRADSASKQGVTLCVRAAAANLPPGTVCKATYTLECVGIMGPLCGTASFKKGVGGTGGRNFWRLAPMPDGFDEAVWAANGLPTSGQLVFRLTVTDVSK